MELRTKRIRGVRVIRPGGKLDAIAARDLQETVRGLLEEGERWIVVDLSRTEQIDRNSILVLMRLRAKLVPPVGGLVLASMTSEVRRALDLTGAAGPFVTFRGLREGIRHLERAIRIKELSAYVVSLLGASEPEERSAAGG